MGEQFVQIPFLPLEKVLHLITSTAGISQNQANRWRYRESGTISLLSISTNDILKLLEEEPDKTNKGYLCQANCAAGTIPTGKGVCRTHKGPSQSFYVLEGRLVEWAYINNGQLPDHAMTANADPDCATRDPLCFVAVAGVTGFGEVLENKGCSIGDDKGLYFDYFVPVVVSDGGATVDPDSPHSPP